MNDAELEAQQEDEYDDYMRPDCEGNHVWYDSEGEEHGYDSSDGEFDIFELGCCYNCTYCFEYDPENRLNKQDIPIYPMHIS